jgi:Phage integrase family
MCTPPRLTASSSSLQTIGRASHAQGTSIQDVRVNHRRADICLTPECGEHFRRINLRWHDLRHEYASRLVERGVPLAQVRDLLVGHASITTIERYDDQKLENQVFVKSSAKEALSDAPMERSETGSWSSDDEVLEDWLGGRDSEPFAACEARRDASRKTCRPAARASLKK